jgi:glycosyltransferase involved in cell wall biosynthesis
MKNISVVMSVFNGEKYLSRALDSILSQSHTNFEFIVINDGSNDGTFEILENYSDKRLKVFHMENQGLAGSLNHAISIAQNEYIARMDADDISHQDRLKLQLKFLVDNPEIDIIGSHVNIIDENDCLLFKKIAPLSNKKITDLLPLQSCIMHSTFMLKKDIYIELGCYRKVFKYAQDYDFLLRALSKELCFANLPDVCLSYRVYDQAPNYKKNMLQIKFSNLARVSNSHHKKKSKLLIEPSISKLEILSYSAYLNIVNYKTKFKFMNRILICTAYSVAIFNPALLTHLYYDYLFYSKASR